MREHAQANWSGWQTRCPLCIDLPLCRWFNWYSSVTSRPTSSVHRNDDLDELY